MGKAKKMVGYNSTIFYLAFNYLNSTIKPAATYQYKIYLYTVCDNSA